MRDNSFSSRILQPNYSLPINDHLSTYKQYKIKLTISNQWKKFSQRQNDRHMTIQRLEK